MNNVHLRIYLDDHLALMVAETELIGRCLRSNRGAPLGEFLQKLENEVQVQKSIVQEIIQRIGAEEGFESKTKQSLAWFAEKLGRLKFNGSLLSYSDLSRVVELEALEAAAQGRSGFWDNLETVATTDVRLEGITFSIQRELAEQHLQDLNTRRKLAAAQAFLD